MYRMGSPKSKISGRISTRVKKKIKTDDAVETEHPVFKIPSKENINQENEQLPAVNFGYALASHN